MRLFVAIYLPSELQRKVWETGSLVKGPWKREPPEKLHITLKFIGEVDEKRFRLIDEVLSQIRFPPFEVEIGGAGVFPHEARPRVIWIGAGGKGLWELQKLVEDSLFRLGIPKEAREFVPHVTLGRAKGKVDVEVFLEKYRSTSMGRFTVKEFTLVESILKPSGSEYQIIRRYPLED